MLKWALGLQNLPVCICCLVLWFALAIHCLRFLFFFSDPPVGTWVNCPSPHKRWHRDHSTTGWLEGRTILNTCGHWKQIEWTCGQKVNLRGSSHWQMLLHASCKPYSGFLKWNLFLSSILNSADVFTAMMNTKITVRLWLSTEDCQRTRAHHLFKHKCLNYWYQKGLEFFHLFNNDAGMFHI